VLARVYDKNNKVFTTPTVTVNVQQPVASSSDSSTAPASKPKTSSTSSTSSSSGGNSGGTSGGGSTADTTAPSAPSSLMLSADDGYTSTLSWTASTDNVGVTGYRIYRDGVLLGSVLGASTTYQDQTVVPGNTYAYAVQATDAASNASSDSNEPSITLVPTSTWIAADSPFGIDTDPSPLELGVKFRPLVNGKVTGVRFYKGAGNTGTHVGRLWTSGGSSLATATFSGETATGWQQVSFSTPVNVTAGTTYVVSYSAPNGHISYTSNYFTSAGITSQYLTAMASGVDGNNGVFAASTGTFPSSSFNDTNYWVDATFIPNPSAGGPAVKTLDTSTVHPGFPGSNNTGIPVGKRLPSRDRGIVIYANGATMENIEVNGEVDIRAGGATIDKSKVNGFVYLDTDDPSASGWDITVRDSEINAGTSQRAAISLGKFTILRTNIHGGQTGGLCGQDCTVSDSWFHDQYLQAGTSWHLGGFLSNGGHDITLTHNTVSCNIPNNGTGGGCSGDINLYGDFSPIQDITLDGNLLTENQDAGFCLSAGYNNSKPFGPNAANVVVINNIFEKGVSGQCAAFGAVTDFTISGTPAPGNVWTNNKYDDGTVVNPQ